jgi:hypothetical protein
MDAIQRLNDLIKDLQIKYHAIILLLDANQTYKECFRGNRLRPYSIEWLHIQRGMDDPFIQLVQHHPNSTTLSPNRDIDWVLTYGINATNISTMAPHFPAHSDHLGITVDLDLGSYFSASYSQLCPQESRLLTSGNHKSTTKYISYITEQIAIHKTSQRMEDLIASASSRPPTLLISIKLTPSSWR